MVPRPQRLNTKLSSPTRLRLDPGLPNTSSVSTFGDALRAGTARAPEAGIQGFLKIALAWSMPSIKRVDCTFYMS